MIHYDPSDFISILSESNVRNGNIKAYLVNENRLIPTEPEYLYGPSSIQTVDTEKISRIKEDISWRSLVYSNFIGVPVIGIAAVTTLILKGFLHM